MQNQKTDSNIVFFPCPFISVTKRFLFMKENEKNSMVFMAFMIE